MSQRANVNLQGGGSRVSYYMSLNVNHDSGLLDSPQIYSFNNNINNLSYNFQNNLQVKVTPTTKIRLNMNAQIQNRKGPNYKTQDLFIMTHTANPIFFPATLPAQKETSTCGSVTPFSAMPHSVQIRTPTWQVLSSRWTKT